MNDRRRQAKSLFLDVVDLPSPGERQAYLASHCADDSELQAEVLELLAHEQELNSFLEPPAQSALPCTDDLPKIPAGTQIGPYKIREQIGEGGMGVVYVAEQIEPVRRKVALKIIKPGLASKDVAIRFEAERQALAMMDHPNIARVFDGGTTTAGQPYFVMELVQGQEITEYCDQQQLSTVERLKLFTSVCRAVQHAHQRGIIHRDLKPSNILVAEVDASPVAKVIDFGVAKAIDSRLTAETVYTQFSQMIGTPLYMSPEQAGLGVIDVDTRSDVYSLGVLLYELLTGHTPFDRETLRQAGYDEMRRLIREVDPPRPSARVSTLRAEALSTISQRRASDPRRLSDSLRGELDWLVMKALEKDRNRRYESASALAADIERFLHGQAIEACPPSKLYRLRKFARRNRAVIVTAGIVTTAVIAGLVGTTWQAVRATRAEQTALEQAERAETEAAIARAVNDFLQNDLLRSGDPDFEPDRDIRLRVVIDRAAEAVSQRFADQPIQEAAVRTASVDADGRGNRRLPRRRLRHGGGAIGRRDRPHQSGRAFSLAGVSGDDLLSSWPDGKGS